MQAYASLEALGDPSRRTLFERLGERGPLSVGELAEALPISRPAVSQHLKILKEAGLVSDTPQGTRRVYRVEASGLEALRAYVEEFWTRALADFKAEAERRDDP